MIYFVSTNQTLFGSDKYKELSPTAAVQMLKTWDVEKQYDSETKGTDAHLGELLLMQFGNKQGTEQIVIDATTVQPQIFKEVIEESFLIGHNLKFDLQWLYNYGIVPLKVYDTMIAEQLLYLGYTYKPMSKYHYEKFKYDFPYHTIISNKGELMYRLSFALDAVAQKRINLHIDKTVRGQIIWRGIDESVILYGAGDVTHLCKIAASQMKEAISKGQKKAIIIECSFVPVMAYLEWCGIKLDEDVWKEKMRRDEEQRQVELDKLNKFLLKWYNEHKGEDNTVAIPYCVDFQIDPHFAARLPNNAKAAGKPYRKKIIKDGQEIMALYQDFLVPFYIKKKSKTIDFIKINLQGDLFFGFNTEPQCTINWASSEQVIYICKLLGFNTTTVDKETGEDKDSVLEKQLKTQKGINDEFLEIYFKFKEADKVCSTYGQSYLNAINPKTGRIHTNFKQLGASSGRMACGSKDTNEDLAAYKHEFLMRLPKNKRKCGYPQLQNLPADKITRQSFASESGNLFCSCDYSALESRLGADIYNEPAMINEYLHGSGDIHSLVAKACFPKILANVAVKDIKKLYPELRKKAKPVEFSQQFGGSYAAIASSLGCSDVEAKEIAKGYNDGFVGIANFKKVGNAFVQENGYVLICKETGHRTYMPGFKEWKIIENDEVFWYEYNQAKKTMRYHDFLQTQICKDAQEHRKVAAKWARLALNAPTQGTGIIILKTAMTNFFRWLVKEGLFNVVKIVDLIHDEACIEYPESMPEISDKLKEFMEKASAKYCHKLPIPAEAEVGHFWIH